MQAQSSERSIPATAVVRLPDDVVREAKGWGSVLTGRKTPGDALAEAWYEYLARHDAELDLAEDEARAKRKEMGARSKHPAARRPKPDGGGTYA